MTSSWFRRKGALQAIFHDEFRKSEHDFPIVFHINFLSGVHGFRDNEVLLPTGYDVIVISPLGEFHTLFVDGIWKSDPQFHSHGSLTYFRAVNCPSGLSCIRAGFLVECRWPIQILASDAAARAQLIYMDHARDEVICTIVLPRPPYIYIR